MVNYSYYKTVYCGEHEIEANKFKRLAEKAEDLVAYYTFDRIYNDNDELTSKRIKSAICELVDNFVELEKSEINSESLGDYSISYNSKPADILSIQKKIISSRLIHTGLMYRGLSL